MIRVISYLLLTILSACGADSPTIDPSIPNDTNDPGLPTSAIPFNVAQNGLNDFFNNPKAENLVITNTNLIAMTSDNIQAGMDVFVSDGKIERIEPTGTPTSGYRIIDGSGKYLMPGLADMHAHTISGEFLTYDLFLFLAQGVTTVRIMWGFDEHVEVRNDINSGKSVGPNVYVASAGFDGTNSSWPGAVNTSTTEDIKDKIDEYTAKGYDFIKVYSSIQSSQHKYLLDYAWHNNIPPVGHVPFGVDIYDAISNGQYSIEHLGQFRSSAHSASDLFQLTASSNVMIGSTLTVINRIRSLTESYKTEWFHWYVSPDAQSFFAQTESHLLSSNVIYLQNRSLAARVQQAGGKLLCGTDTGIRYVLPGVSVHEELLSYAEAGISNYEVLKTTTIHPAEFLMKTNEGRIDIGYKADLLLLGANPLENIANTETIEGVAKSGQWMSSEDISQTLEYLRAFYRR